MASVGEPRNGAAVLAMAVYSVSSLSEVIRESSTLVPATKSFLFEVLDQWMVGIEALRWSG